MGEKPWARPAALDRPWRQRRLVERLASAAGQARAHDALHHEAAGDVLQFFGDIFAQPLEAAAAVRAALARRKMHLLARQVVRQGAALRLPLRGGCRLGRRLGRPRDLLILQPELQLVERLRGGAEALSAQTGELMLELLDQQIAVAQIGVPHRQLGPRG